MPHDFFHVEAKSIPWQPLPARGMSVKVLSRQLDGGPTVILLRAEAGYEIPAHRHGQPVNAYIVSGSLHAADGTFFPTASLIRIPAFMRHGPFRAEGEMIALAWFPSEPTVVFDDGSVLLFTPEGLRSGSIRM